MTQPDIYNPLVQLRRDFNEDVIYLNAQKTPVINDPDIKKIMQFYSQNIQSGTLLNLGAGTTHFHYLLPVVDRLIHITALDLEPAHNEILSEFKNVFDNKNFSSKYISQQDFQVLKRVAEVTGKKSPEKTLRDIFSKSLNSNNQLDLVEGDMYNLEILGGKKFDNIILSFSLYIAQNDQDFIKLFSGIQKHLTKKGKLLIADFLGFSESLEDDFPESPLVQQKYKAPLLTPENITNALEKSGFSDIKIELKPVEFAGEEQTHNLIYLFASAQNKLGN